MALYWGKLVRSPPLGNGTNWHFALFLQLQQLAHLKW